MMLWRRTIDGVVRVSKLEAEVAKRVDRDSRETYQSLLRTLERDVIENVQQNEETEIVRDDQGRFAEVVPENVDRFDTETRLEHATELATDVESARDRGIVQGNTKADEMVLLDYEDGTTDYATPVDVYDDPNPLGITGEDAIDNNIHGAETVDAFGGDAAQAAVIEIDGRDHIIKEGKDGETMYRRDYLDLNDTQQESLRDTMVAGYFAGNTDLHGANMVVSEDAVSIIDNDASFEMDDSQFIGFTLQGMGPPGLSEEIYDTAFAIRDGGIDLDAVPDEKRALVEHQTELALEMADRAGYTGDN